MLTNNLPKKLLILEPMRIGTKVEGEVKKKGKGHMKTKGEGKTRMKIKGQR